MSQLTDIKTEIGSIVRSLSALAAKARLAGAEVGVQVTLLTNALARLTPFLQEPPVVAVPDPPIVVPPIIVDPPPIVPGAPDFSMYGFAHLIPTWRQHLKPTEAQCDWIIDGAVHRATSLKGLPVVTYQGTDVVRALYNASLAAGHGPRITFGLKGNCGAAYVGGLHDSSGGWHPADICRRAQDGSWLPQDVQFVGLTPDAEIAITWGGPFGFTQRLAGLSLGLVGQPTTHALGQSRHCGEIIFDDFWILRPIGQVVDYHALLHLALWDRLVLRGLKRRTRPGEAPLTTSGHIPYLKHSQTPGSETWILNNDFKGGNQTNMQKRPGKDEADLTSAGRDTIIVANNFSDGYGFDHTNFGGGSALTHWSSPHAHAFYIGNRITDARGGCFMVGGQPLYTGSAGGQNVVNFDRNWYDAEGYPIGEVYVDGNVFENPRGDRHCVSLSNAKRIYWGDRNRIVGPANRSNMTIHSEFIATSPPVMPRGNVTFVGDPTKIPTRIVRYDAAANAERPVSPTEIQAMHMPAWPVMPL